ncbi:hypothetical protein SAMN02745126_06469 [Enhydrobacter aerosaccus]|uniref:Uncharacterized protein n=1 Tax=Enhydrobacter aerosaccus TaxID=225324 RepID=A0A1T4TLH3_9HYPH|nr:hypothetical protein [Enhydrobacter aerosaccus]SKA41089.1 hypothetical protein SAMN02745126_06469 [Enhydrobacter aerosaccus]
MSRVNLRKLFSVAGYWLIISVGCIALSGCGPTVTVLQAKKAENYATKIKNLLVAFDLYSPVEGKTNSNALINFDEMKQACNDQWVALLGHDLEYVDISDLPEVSFDEKTKAKVLAATVAATNPTHVLELNVDGAVLTQWAIDGYTVKATLVDVAEKKVVWQTKVAFNTFTQSGRTRTTRIGRYSHHDDANDLVKALTTRLKADGLL